jgi:hypothetical protein
MDTNAEEKSQQVTAQVELIIDKNFVEKRPLSASSTKAFNKSPKHYIEYLRTRYDKTEFAIGKACETILLEPEKVKDKFDIFKKFDRKSDAAKERWANMVLEAEKNKVTLINSDDFALASIMAENALANDNVRYWIERKRNIQRKLYWHDRKTGLPVVGYIDFDVETDEHISYLDIKTDYNGEPKAWFRHASDLGYKNQVGCYLEGAHRCFYEFPDFLFIVIEKAPPFNSYVVYCPGDYCNEAREEFRFTLKAFKFCMDNQQFDLGYDFWLFDTLPYFTMKEPKYKKSKRSLIE